MAGEFDEQGSPPESPGRNLGGPAHRDRPFAEHREDARIPVETGGDDVRRDREGDGPPTAGGQHRDAGAPASSLGRQARHQEGGQRPSRAFVPTECPLVRNPRAHRPRGTGEDRSHRGESKEAQDLRLGFADRLSVRTLFPVPTRTRSAIFRNRPCPTTPGIASIWPASFSADARLRNRASRMWFPLSVRNASPDARRRSTEAPRDSSDFAAKRQPNGWTSTGTGAFTPRRDTSLDSSTMTTNCCAAAATIFSRNSAPPRPLIKSSFGSTSSAPSTARSANLCPMAFQAFAGPPVTPDQYRLGSATTAYGGISFLPAGERPFTRSGFAVRMREVSPAPAWPSPSGSRPSEA